MTTREPTVHYYSLLDGIRRTPGFQKKGLATHSVNVGLKCGHDCTYCSTGASVRLHRAFGRLGLSPLDRGYAIVDPSAPERVLRDARRVSPGDTVMLCTITDAWSPEAQELRLGPRCLTALLKNSDCQIRILTKSAAVRGCFDAISPYRRRVIVGMTVTAHPDLGDVARVVEPHASPISARLDALMEARRRGLRTYVSATPILPGRLAGPAHILRLFDMLRAVGPEMIVFEPVNPRGRGLIYTADALRAAGLSEDADAVDAARNRKAWARYASDITIAALDAARKLGLTDILHVLLYENELLEPLKRTAGSIVWL